MPVPLEQLRPPPAAPRSPPYRTRVALARDQRVVESPGGLSEVGGHEERLIADHDVPQERLIGFRQLAAKRLPVIELQRAAREAEWPARSLD